MFGSEKRPARDFTTGPLTRGVRAAAVLLSVGLVLWTALNLGSMPDQVPAQVGMDGEVTRWAGKGEVIAVNLLFLAITLFMAWLSPRPQIFNYPMQITETNAQPVYREGERFMVAMTLGMALIHLTLALFITGRTSGDVVAFAGLALVVVSFVWIGRIVLAARRAERAG